MNVRNTDYSRLLADCLKLYEELEGALDSINRLVTDIELGMEDIWYSFESIDCRMECCTEQLRCLMHIEPLRNTNFQDTFTDREPEAGGSDRTSEN